MFEGRIILRAYLLLSLLVAMATWATPALAERTYESQITGFSNPWGATVDTNDNAWISDPGNGGLITEYNAEGTKVGEQTGEGHYGATYIRSLGVDNVNEDLYVADSGPVVIDVFEGTGTFLETFTHSFGGGYLYVAVDNSGLASNGRFYVAATSADSVQAFDATGAPVSFTAAGSYISENAITGTPENGNFGEPWNIATDQEGNIYVVDKSRHVIDEFMASGEFVQEFTGSGAPLAFSNNLTGVAVDPTSGDVLVVDAGNDVIDEFSSTKEYLGQLTGISETEPFGSLNGGLAVNSEGFVYVPDGANHVVDIFSPDVVLPKIAYGSVTDPTRTSGTLNATIDTNEGGNVNTCQFEYGTTPTYGADLPCSPSTPYSAPTGVSAGVTGLIPETTYHYRVVAVNANGTKKGQDRTYTPHSVTQIRTEAGSGITSTHATFNGSFVGNSEDTRYYFEWGEDTSYGNSTAIPPGDDAGSPVGPNPTAVSTPITGLAPETTYHYRVVATNGLGTSHGEDVSFTTQAAVVELKTLPATGVKAGVADLNASFVGNGEDTHYYFEWGEDSSYGSTTAGPPGEDAGSPTGPAAAQLSAHLTGLAAETTYHYRVVASNGIGTTMGQDETFQTSGPISELQTTAPTGVMASGATFTGSFNPEPLDTHYYFVYHYLRCIWQRFGEHEPNELRSCETGPEEQAPAVPVDAGIPNGPTSVEAHVDLAADTTYYYRIIAFSSLGASEGTETHFRTPPQPPAIRNSLTSEVHTDVATATAEIDPGESATTAVEEPGVQPTSYYFEFGLAPCSTNACTSTSSVAMGEGTTFLPVSSQLPGLAPGTTYYWRVVSENEGSEGPVYGPDQQFTTYPFVDLGHDSCPNAHVRQQTGAAGLLDCRAYELVSAADTGGYDVESDLVGGQTPYGSYPAASSPPRVLYGVHDGGIPGVGAPTNRGVDPYVATLGESGWTTEYVGIPSNIDPTSGPFASELGEASSGLESFAFAGNDICRPCFGSGIRVGIPVHLPNGALVQGMAGSLDPGPAAEPSGHIGRYLSADGTHLVFGSTSQFEPDGNNNGDISIYDRNLETGLTHVVSKSPDHSTLTGPGIAELGMSDDGSRILVGQRVSADADGNVYWHPYLNIGDADHTVDLMPGAAAGALFNGMTRDGSAVIVTTKAALGTISNPDTDSSADVYRIEMSETGATATRVSAGSTAGNTDACDPVPNSTGEHWNTIGPVKDCSAVAIGGANVPIASNGSVYFLSPELLDGAGNGVAEQPNLYVSVPGQPLHFITVLSPDDRVVLDAIGASETTRTADFEVTPSGNFASFVSRRQLTEFDNAGHAEIYRYDTNSEELTCVSCNLTGLKPLGDAAMASNGLSLAADGRVFFTSGDQLVARDGDHRQDAYEWVGGEIGLISAGTSSFDSSLLGVSSNGDDVYFFTHDTLVPQDHNGDLVKIYDARVLGGVPYVAPPVQCKASDECHGAGSPVPGPPLIHSNAGAGGNTVNRGKKSRHHKKHHHKRRHRHHPKTGRSHHREAHRHA